MKPITRPGWILALLLALGALRPPPSQAQSLPRLYWKTLVGTNAVPLMVESVTGNTNPFSPAHAVAPGANIAGTLAIAGYLRAFSLFDRSATAAVLEPVGRLAGEVDGEGLGEPAAGFGDPMIEVDVNVLGPRAQKNLPDVLRYEPGFSVDLLGDLVVPIGEYDGSQPLNLGMNRWYGRLGAPVLWQLGPWVPGRRTTLEFLPAVWLFGDNGDYLGKTLSTDPILELDGHLTRDFTEQFWGSLDGSWWSGGGSSVDGVPGPELDNLGVGFTLGSRINDNLSATFGYMSTVNDGAPEDLRLDMFTISFVYGWHPLLEGVRRLEGAK